MLALRWSGNDERRSPARRWRSWSSSDGGSRASREILRESDLPPHRISSESKRGCEPHSAVTRVRRRTHNLGRRGPPKIRRAPGSSVLPRRHPACRPLSPALTCIYGLSGPCRVCLGTIRNQEVGGSVAPCPPTRASTSPRPTSPLSSSRWAIAFTAAQTAGRSKRACASGAAAS